MVEWKTWFRPTLSSATRSNPVLQRPRTTTTNVKRTYRFGVVIAGFVFGLVALSYVTILVQMLWNHQSSNKITTNIVQDDDQSSISQPLAANQQQQQQLQQQHNQKTLLEKKPSVQLGSLQKVRSTYAEWRDLALELAALPADQILSTLIHEDPFGVRKFEERLLQTESDRQAILSLEDIATLFPCPVQERITLPDQRNHDLARKFRQGIQKPTSHKKSTPKEDFVYLFFQHLRKAGGTNFCSLAQHNLHPKQVPSYFCMPDMYWSDKRCAGCFMKFSNEFIDSQMYKDGHRILGNEWDPFEERFFQLPAVFATSFRRPLDRALSQFRFECIEDRGCKFKEVEPWWKKRTDLTNVYTWTFSQMGLRKISIGTSKKDAKQRQVVMQKALDTVAKYNLVLVMEWLAYAPKHTQDVLGFADTSTMTERIRPHIHQAKRNDGQEHNALGAAGIAKASWTPEQYLSPQQYKIMSENLALDEILTDAARRMFLERIVCPDMAESNWT